MNLIKWIEKKTFLRGSIKEFEPIKLSSGSSYACTIQVHELGSCGNAVARIRMHQSCEVSYYDLSEEAAKILISQLAKIVENRKITEPAL